MRTCSMALVVVVLILIAGCGGSPAESSAQPTASWLVAELPAGAVPVAEAKRTAREGQLVVVRGRIGGRDEPLTHGAAVFVMMDPALPSCEALGHGCPKPWDYCCESPESIMANSATVQVVGDTGGTLAVDLAAYGMHPLDEVVVVGTVGPRPVEATLVIRAQKIHRVSG